MCHCVACDAPLDNPPMRAIEEHGQLVCVIEEDMCPKCLDIAMRAVHNRDLTDDQQFAAIFGGWEDDDGTPDY